MNSIENSPTFWKTVLNTMSEGVMLVKKGGTILFVNRAMEMLTGYSQQELIGQTCAFLQFDCCNREPDSRRQNPCPLFKDGSLTSARCTLRRKDGIRLSVLKNGQVMNAVSGDTIFAVEVQSDITKLQDKERQISVLRRIISERYGFQGMVGASPPMENLFDLVKKAAMSDAPVLIFGESGTGKELVAKAIHKLGKRSKGPFIRVNCAALSESLLESELFGHVKGAFTGADRSTKGRFEAADGGDIFLDEIGDISLATQVRLLRVLQEKEFERVGDYRPVAINVRVIAATHRDLRAAVRQVSFREDLFYRLNVIPIFIPPLRERSGDIPLLVEHFIRQTAAVSGKRMRGVDRETMELLRAYNWPGNVRELMNAIEYAFVVAGAEVITRSDLPEMSFQPQEIISSTEEGSTVEDKKESLLRALTLSKGSRASAARILGVSRQTVWSRIKKYGINIEKLMS